MAILPPADAESQTRLSDKASLTGERSEPPVFKGVGEVKDTVASIAEEGKEEGLFSKSKRENTKIGFSQVVFRIIPDMIKNFFVYVFNIIFCCRKPKQSNLDLSVIGKKEAPEPEEVVNDDGTKFIKRPKDHLRPLLKVGEEDKKGKPKQEELIAFVIVHSDTFSFRKSLRLLKAKDEIESLHTLRFLEFIFERPQLFQHFCSLMTKNDKPYKVGPQFREQTAKRLQKYNTEDPAEFQQLLQGFAKIVGPHQQGVDPDKLLQRVPPSNCVEGWVDFLRYIMAVHQGEHTEDLVPWTDDDYDLECVSSGEAASIVEDPDNRGSTPMEDNLNKILDAIESLDLIGFGRAETLQIIDQHWKELEGLDTFALLYGIFTNEDLAARLKNLYEPDLFHPTRYKRYMKFKTHIKQVMQKKPLDKQGYEILIEEINKGKQRFLINKVVSLHLKEKEFGKLFDYMVNALPIT